MRAKTEKAAGKQKTALLDMLVNSHDFPLPETLLDQELERLVVNEKYSKNKAGEPAGAEEPSEDEDARLAEELRPKAVLNVKSAIILGVIAEKEGVIVTEDELKARINLLAKHFQTTPENVVNLFVTKDGSLDNLTQMMKEEKVLDIVLSRAEKVKSSQAE